MEGRIKVFAQGVTWDPSFLYCATPNLSHTCALMYTYMYVASPGCSPPDPLNCGVVWVPQRWLGG